VKEVVELASEGGTIELRDTLREPRGEPRVLILGLDGVGDAMFREALTDGSLPQLAALAGARGEGSDADGGVLDHGYLVPNVVSVLPSITLAAWTSVFTGHRPAETGVPGNEWFDRETDRFHAPAPVSVSGDHDALASLTDGLLGEWIRTPTLFERAGVRSHVSMLPVHRGADLLTVPSVQDLVGILAAFPAGVTSDRPVEREAYAELDATSAQSAAEAMEEHGVPDLQVVYFPGIDLFTHATADSEASQRRYLNEVLDPAIGVVLDAYRRVGVLEETWVLVVADHGHTPVPADDVYALGGTPRSPVALLDSLGWRVRPQELEVEEGSDHQAVVAYQGAFAYVYLADRSTCRAQGAPCAWSRPPAEADLHAVARAFSDAGAEDALEAVLIPRRDEDGAYLDVDLWGPAGPRPLREHPATADTALMRFPERLGWLLDGPQGYLAGDLILMARSGAWVPYGDRFYFSHPYHSWHGSAHPQDSRIPLLVARADTPGEAVRRRVQATLPPAPGQQDIARLILDLLGVPEGR
jgi:hypothetical protein